MICSFFDYRNRPVTVYASTLLELVPRRKGHETELCCSPGFFLESLFEFIRYTMNVRLKD